MNDRRTGGPAFPAAYSQGLIQSGMSLRDAFAIAALKGPVTAIWMQYDGQERAKLGGNEFLAQTSYAIADAMLKEAECE